MEFQGLGEDVAKRLRARGIDAEESCRAWLAGIRDGSWPLSRFERAARVGHPSRLTRDRVPLVIPLAVVLPADDDEQNEGGERQGERVGGE